MSDPILSRFDIMCVLRDEVDASVDSDLATFIINSHIKSHPNVEEGVKLTALLDDPKKADKIGEDIISQDLLKKYIIYARKYCHPALNKTNVDKITNFYAEIRKESQTIG